MLRLSLRMLQLPLLVLVLMGLVWTINRPSVGDDGVYIVCMTADPDESVDMKLMINGMFFEHVAYGRKGVIGGLTVAVPLRKGDRVSYQTSGESEAATHLDINLASYSTNYFQTIRSDGSSKTWPYTSVQFRHWLSDEAVWKSVLFPTTTIQVPKTGMYWVMARPDCDEGWADLDIAGLFTAYCGNDQALSASGAFRLEIRTRLYMRWTGGHTVESATILSYVLLDHNNNIAFTAMGNHGDFQLNDVGFGGKRMTDYGNLYDHPKRRWTIPRRGTYLIALRGSPNGGSTRYDLYTNFNHGGEPFFSFWAERGVRSGQAAGFHFDVGDKLLIHVDFADQIEPKQMISIALLIPD